MHSPLRTKALNKVLKKLDHLEQNWKDNPVTVMTPSSMENILFQQRVEKISNLTLPAVEEDVKMGLLELQEEVFPTQQTPPSKKVIPSTPVFDSPTFMFKKKHHNIQPNKQSVQTFNLFETIFSPMEIQTIFQRILLYCPVSVLLYLKYLITSHQYVKIQDMFLKRIPRKKSSNISSGQENDLWAQQFTNFTSSPISERKEVTEKPESPFRPARFLRGLKSEKLNLVFLGLERLGFRKQLQH